MRIPSRITRIAPPLALVAAVAALGADVASAAPKPSIAVVVEGREADSGRPLVTFVGKRLGGVSAVDVLDGAQMSVGSADVVSKSQTQVILRLPEGIDPGAYTLAITAGKGEPLAVPFVVRGAALLTDGSNAMTGALRSASNDGVAFGGTSAIGGDPPTGAGVRMVWYPKVGAFRAGRANGTEWDAANIGGGSVAMGTGCVASGPAAIAMGAFASATSDATIAFGDNVTASGDISTAIGASSVASGTSSFALGYQNQVSGDFALACGADLIAQSLGSCVIGTGNVAAGTPRGVVATDPLFVCGNGTAEARSNALTLLKNGNLTITGTLTQNSDARLKTDIAPLTDVAARIAKLRGVSYAFADTTKHPAGRHIGLLAQDVREAFPELVTEDADGTLSVAYGNLAAVLVEAVKEQSAAIAARDGEIASLRKDQSALTERLARIEALLEKTK